MYQAVTILVVGLTIAGFVIKNGLLLLGAGLTWVGFAFVFYNVGTGAGEPFEGNAYLPMFFLMLGGAMAIVCFVSTLNVWVGSRRRPSSDDEQEAYKKKVLKATKRR